MSYRPDTPFDSVESAHEYVRLLEEAIAEAKCDVAADVSAAPENATDRRLEAQRLVHYKLEKLEQHLHQSSRLLNDLRSLRRLLFDERPAMVEAAPSKKRSVAA